MERGRKGGVEVQGDKIAIKKGASTFGREKNIIKLSISQAKNVFLSSCFCGMRKNVKWVGIFVTAGTMSIQSLLFSNVFLF